LYSNNPDFALILTTSHTFFHNKPFQTKDSLEIIGVSAKISDSVEPTILYSSSSLESEFLILTTDHILTFSVLSADSLIISTLLS
jgi:hypothetical protein